MHCQGLSTRPMEKERDSNYDSRSKTASERLTLSVTWRRSSMYSNAWARSSPVCRPCTRKKPIRSTRSLRVYCVPFLSRGQFSFNWFLGLQLSLFKNLVMESGGALTCRISCPKAGICSPNISSVLLCRVGWGIHRGTSWLSSMV